MYLSARGSLQYCCWIPCGRSFFVWRYQDSLIKGVIKVRRSEAVPPSLGTPYDRKNRIIGRWYQYYYLPSVLFLTARPCHRTDSSGKGKKQHTEKECVSEGEREREKKGGVCAHMPRQFFR